MSVYMICSAGLFICVALVWVWAACGFATTNAQQFGMLSEHLDNDEKALSELAVQQEKANANIDILEARDRQFHDDLNALAKNHATSIAELRDRMDALDNRADATALDYGRVMQVLAEKLKCDESEVE